MCLGPFPVSTVPRLEEERPFSLWRYAEIDVDNLDVGRSVLHVVFQKQREYVAVVSHDERKPESSMGDSLSHVLNLIKFQQQIL